MKYTVSATVTVSIHTCVEADNEEAARTIAEARPMQSVMDCERLGESPEDVWSLSGELDGEAQIQRIEPR